MAKKPKLTPKKNSWPGFDKVLKRADVTVLIAAVARVYIGYAGKMKQPGAEKWQNDTRGYNAEMVHDVTKRWRGLSSEFEHLFPWHNDFVTDQWVRFRKLTLEKKLVYADRFGIEITPEARAALDKRTAEEEGE